MAAILRVKRRNDDEPLTALVVASKRRKTAEDDEEGVSTSLPLKTVVKFAGTVQNQEDDVVEHLVKTLGKDKLKSNFKQHPVDVINKTREKVKQNSVENRYKVVNCFRSLDTSNVEELEDKVMTVIDVEDSISCSALDAVSSKRSDDYVYDIYYGDTGNISVDDFILVRNLEDELLSFGDIGESDNEYESEDSNSESNVRNDYPDSDHSEGSINEDDMVNAIMNVRLNDESDLSSEEDYAYAINEGDVEQYGYKYAKYKAKVKKELGEDDSDDSGASNYSGLYSNRDSSENSDDDE